MTNEKLWVNSIQINDHTRVWIDSSVVICFPLQEGGRSKI